MKSYWLVCLSFVFALWLPSAQAARPLPLPAVLPGPCGKATKPVVPAYPIEALRKAQRGWVLVSFNVSREGIVSDATVREASPKGIFEASALAAVSASTYPPAEEMRQSCQKVVEFTIGRWD